MKNFKPQKYSLEIYLAVTFVVIATITILAILSL